MLPWIRAPQTPTTVGLELAPADWVGLGVLCLFAALGAWRGLWWQCFRAVSIALTLGIAWAFTPALARWLHGLWPGLGPVPIEALSFLVLFVASALLLGKLGRFGASALEGLKLGLLDRVAGLLAGALTALLLFAVLVSGARYFGPEAWAQETLRGTRSERLADDFEQLLQYTHRRWPAWRWWLAERLREGEAALSLPAPGGALGPATPPVEPEGEAALPTPSAAPKGAVR